RDWSSDVCSSDLIASASGAHEAGLHGIGQREREVELGLAEDVRRDLVRDLPRLGGALLAQRTATVLADRLVYVRGVEGLAEHPGLYAFGLVAGRRGGVDGDEDVALRRGEGRALAQLEERVVIAREDDLQALGLEPLLEQERDVEDQVLLDGVPRARARVVAAVAGVYDDDLRAFGRLSE